MPSYFKAVSIRPARRHDIPGILRVVEAALREHGLWRAHNGPGAFDDLKGLPRSYTRRGGAFLVIEEQGRVVGCGGLLVQSRGDGQIQRMYLAKKLRGRGLGRALHDKLEAAAKKAGLKRLVLETSPRFKAALRLYHAAGYRTTVRDIDNCCFLLLSKRLKI